MDRKNLFEELLRTAGEQSSSFPESSLTAFWPMRGHNWKGKLMVVGRAVNGWAQGWPPAVAVDPVRRADILAKTLHESEPDGGKCPMLWVSTAWGAKREYNTKRSAFWRVVRKTVGVLDICDPGALEWPSSLIWSNLYKLSPSAGGNPSGPLVRLQHEVCVQLLRQELIDYRPARVLCLTGKEWAEPFLLALGEFTPRWKGPGPVEVAGALKIDTLPSGIAVVVAKHPQGKSEAAYLDQLSDAWAAVAWHCITGPGLELLA